MLRTGLAVLVVAAVVGSVAGTAAGQVHLRGLEWAYIGDVSNAPIPASISENFHAQGVGRVDHAYSITTTPVTVENWLDFVLAWSPYHENHFTSGFASIGGSGINYSAISRQWSILPGLERGEATASWRLAAIYANWLHNDQRTDEEAFLSGAYDISTFGGSGFNITDQLEPSPGAKFWIPTRNEWIKAMYYDPNRFGEGEEGYWLYPHGSDAQPIPGAPGEGETNIGWGFVIDVGSYPDVMSPYGLLDGASGVVEELSPTAYDPRVNTRKKVLAPFDLNSHIVYGDASTGANFSVGFRLATRVPGPGGLVVMGVFAGVVGRRRR